MELEHLPQAVPKLNQEALKSLRWAFPDAEWKVGVGGGGDWQEKWGGWPSRSQKPVLCLRRTTSFRNR